MEKHPLESKAQEVERRTPKKSRYGPGGLELSNRGIMLSVSDHAESGVAKM